MKKYNKKLLENKLKHINPEFHEALKCTFKPEKEYGGLYINTNGARRIHSKLDSLSTDAFVEARKIIYNKYGSKYNDMTTLMNDKKVYSEFLNIKSEFTRNEIEKNPKLINEARCYALSTLVENEHYKYNNGYPPKRRSDSFLYPFNISNVSTTIISEEEFKKYKSLSKIIYDTTKECYKKSLMKFTNYEYDDYLEDSGEKMETYFTKEFLNKIEFTKEENTSDILPDTYTYNEDLFNKIFCELNEDVK